MTQLFINNFSAILTQTFGPTDTFMRLDTVTGLPPITGGDHLLLTVFKKVGADEFDHEVVRVTAIVMDQLEVVRAQEGTTAQTFLLGDRVEARATAGTFALKADIAALDNEIADRLAADAGLQAAIDLKANSVDVYTKPQADAATVAAIEAVVGAAPAALDTLSEIAAQLANDQNAVAALTAVVATKVTAVQAAAAAPVQSVNGETGQVVIPVHDLIRTPTPISPLTNTTGVTLAPTLSASAFAAIYNPDTRTHRQFQVALASDAEFASPVFNANINADSISVSPALSIGTAYAWRCRDVTALYTSEWMSTTEFATANISVSTPTVTVSGSPSSVPESPTISTSAFATSPAGQDTHASTDWEVRRTSDNTLVFSSYANVSSKTSIVVPSGVLAVNTSYEFRARHNGTTYGASAYGSVTATTSATFNNFIATPAATPAAAGDPFEGGFYTGMVWNQRTQSASSHTIATGSKVFTTTDNMAVTPLFYSGQIVEVRSRANPANRMRGTVTAASGTSLTINVTTTNGSGTFTDWSVMCRFRVIVAPKAAGDTTRAYKNANTAAPAATGTLSEGFLATQAMFTADTATVYPAAHFCRGLTVGGFTDWYLPARDELELCWRNLKPTLDNNYISADRPTGATPNYANLGSFGDVANTHGTNNNSEPPGVAYTATVPGRTAATAFHTGGAEAFAYGSEFYWSSTEYSASFAWGQYWNTSFPGYQGNNGKTSVYRVRAVRRSVI